MCVGRIVVTRMLQEWFTTVYGINLPVEAALATVTMLILHVDNPLFRVGAAVLKLLKEPLLSMSLEGLMTVRPV